MRNKHTKTKNLSMKLKKVNLKTPPKKTDSKTYTNTRIYIPQAKYYLLNLKGQF